MSIVVDRVSGCGTNSSDPTDVTTSKLGIPEHEKLRRVLLAVVHADVVGFCRLVEKNDVDTWRRLHALRRDLFEPLLRCHGGRIVNTAGDALLMAFGSITAAVRFSMDLQAGLLTCEPAGPEEDRIRFRLGIHIGDVIASEGEICGVGINIAARLQTACPPGGVCVSRAVLDLVQRQDRTRAVRVGRLALRNIAAPIEAFTLGDVTRAGLATRWRELRAVVIFIKSACQNLSYKARKEMREQAMVVKA